MFVAHNEYADSHGRNWVGNDIIKLQQNKGIFFLRWEQTFKAKTNL